MRERILRWLEWDKIQLESLKKLPIKFLKMLPIILGSIFLYLALTRIGEGHDPHSIIGQLTSIVPVLSYCVWGMLVFILILKPVRRSGIKNGVK